MVKRETWLEYVQRISSGVPRKDIARAADIDPSGLSRWFRGEHPSAEKVVAFARGLQQSPIEALVAAGYLEPHEAAGVIEVVRSRAELSNAELIIELGKRLAERPARRRVDDITARLARPEGNGKTTSATAPKRAIIDVESSSTGSTPITATVLATRRT